MCIQIHWTCTLTLEHVKIHQKYLNKSLGKIYKKGKQEYDSMFQRQQNTFATKCVHTRDMNITYTRFKPKVDCNPNAHKLRRFVTIKEKKFESERSLSFGRQVLFVEWRCQLNLAYGECSMITISSGHVWNLPLNKDTNWTHYPPH